MIACPGCLKWPLRCSGRSLQKDPNLDKQRWRNDVLRGIVAEASRTSVDARLLPLFELVKPDWRSHTGSVKGLELDSPACKGDPSRLARRRDDGGGSCGLDCLHLAPKYNQLTARLLYRRPSGDLARLS